MQSGGLSSQIIKVCTHDLFLLLKATVVRNEITRTVREDRAVLPSHWLPFLCFSNPFQKPREVNHASVVTIHNLVMGPSSYFYIPQYSHKVDVIYLFHLNSQMMPVRNMPCSYGNHQTWWCVSSSSWAMPSSPYNSMRKIGFLFTYSEGFSGGASGKEPTCQCKKHKRHRFNPLVRKIPWRGKWQPTPVFLPGNFHGQRSLTGYGQQPGPGFGN